MASNGKVHTVTDETFDAQVKESDTLTLVDFAHEYEGRLKVCKVDVDVNQRTAQQYAVRSIPSLLFFKEGKVVETVVGAVRKQRLEEVIEAHI